MLLGYLVTFFFNIQMLVFDRRHGHIEEPELLLFFHRDRKPYLAPPSHVQRPGGGGRRREGGAEGEERGEKGEGGGRRGRRSF